MSRIEVIESPYQIICEGADDCDLFGRLVRDLPIAGFQVGCGRGDDGRCLGKDGFGKRIDAIKNTTIVPIQGYVIIADNDDDPSDRFNRACGHLRDNKLPVPPAGWQIARDAAGIKSAVLMIPATDRQGGLESLILDCCAGVSEYADCIDAFCGCVATADVTARRQLDADKLRLRALIAATYPSDPGIAISYWLSSETRPFAMTHGSLTAIADFLRSFSTA